MRTLFNDYNTKAHMFIYRYQININACHPSCLTCNGKESNQCTSCQYGSPGTCYCNQPNQFFLNGKCVPSCLDGYVANGQFCYPMKGCQNADPKNNGKCLTCQSSFYNNDGICQTQSIVPPGYEQKGANFILSALQYNEKNKVYFQAFNSYTFSHLEILNKDIQIKNTLVLNPKQSKITSCNGVNIVGGFFSNISGTSIVLPIISYSHSQVAVVFKIYIIDVAERISDVIVNLQIEDKIIGTYQISNKLQKGYFCGYDQIDATDDAYISFSISDLSSAEVAKNLTIVNKSTNYKSGQNNNIYLGIRDITIIGFECVDPQCVKCQNNYGNQCDLCKSPYTVKEENFTCVECAKISGYYTSSDGKSCKKCHSSCLECSQGSNQNCTKCRDKMYLSLSNECLPCPTNCSSCSEAGKCDKCENNFYFDQSKNCVSCNGDHVFIRDTFFCENCDSSCMRCKGKQPTDCTKCNDKKYFQNSLCIECNSSQGYISGEQCITCDNSCKSCKGSGPNQCTSCYEAQYLSKTNECKPCIQNCKNCIDEKSCQLCYDPYQIHEKTLQCVQCNQISGFYPNANYCRKCDSSCKECNGGSSNNCLQCNLGTYLSLSKCLDCPNNCAVCKDSKICTQCMDSFYFDKSNNCVQCTGDYVFIRDKFYCDSCDSSCMRCTGKQPTDCTKCNDKKYFQNSLCIECNSSQGFIQDDKCIPCHKSCKSCNGAGLNQCKSCQEGNYLTITNECQNCISNCKNCTDNSSCKLCYSPYTIHEVSLQCVQCQSVSGFYKDVDYCRKCNPICKECSGGLNTQCTQCYQETYLSHSTCLACPSNCLDCLDSQSCNKCKDNYLVHEVTKQCVICESQKGYFKQGNYCRQCNPACKECFGPTDAECYTCNEFYFRIETSQNRCQQCPSNFYLESTKKDCKNCNYQCIPCNKFNEIFNMIDITHDQEINKMYCLVCSCIQCYPDYIFFNQKQCTKSCEYIGLNYVTDLNTNSCQCQRGFQFRIQNIVKNSFDCSQVYPLGFYCDSSKVCMKCSQNCIQCSQNLQCIQCIQGFYNWDGFCYEDCLSSLNLVSNTSTGMCECKEGFEVQKRSNIQNENKICQKILQIESIQVYNYLMQSQDIQFSQDFSFDKKNLVRIKFNRHIQQEEFKSFQLLIDPNNLTQGQEYKIISTSQDESFIDIIVEQELNRRAQQFTISISESTFNYYTTNTILISNQISTTMESNVNTIPITQTFQSVSQAFASDDNSKQSQMINFFKQFQVLCLFSNFMQVLPLLYLIRDSLPPKINFASLLGASLIFKKIPPPSQNFFTTKQIHLDNIGSSNYYLEQTLGSFGISNNLYDNFLCIHIIVLVSSILILVCTLFRRIMKGKQHTVKIINILLNQLCTYLQSSLTAINFCISFSLIQNQKIYLPILSMLFYSFIYIVITYQIYIQQNNYLQLNIPNTFGDINNQMKGAKTYLLFSYAKKYLIILIYLNLFYYQFFCAIASSITFGISALYLIYFRFFKQNIINYIKIIQELLISVLFALIAATTKKMNIINKQDTILNEDLLYTEKMGGYILITVVLCLFTSLILQVIRTVFSLYESYQTYKKNKLEKQQKQLELQKLIDSFDLDNKECTDQNKLSNLSFRKSSSQNSVY
ncbi:hypothetical protein ABPG74_007794 [Tetrahymena malaccensis]